MCDDCWRGTMDNLLGELTKDEALIAIEQYQFSLAAEVKAIEDGFMTASAWIEDLVDRLYACYPDDPEFARETLLG
jgi:hypothetical protein